MKKKSVVIQAKSGWKPVEIDTASFEELQWEGFSGLEELSSYDIVKAENSVEPLARPAQEGSRKKKKRKKDGKGAVKRQCARSSTTKYDEVVMSNPAPADDTRAPVDMSAWLNCCVPEPVLKSLEELNFTQPTKIQAAVLPSAIRDHMDVMGAAETGSGKTLAFGIPIIHHILQRKLRSENPLPLQALVLTPTRELAMQVKRHLEAVAKYTNIRVVEVVGGLSADKQLRLLKHCPEIVVATPGRLWELVDQGAPHLGELNQVRHLVIDEADRMVEKNHFEDLTKLLTVLNAPTGEEGTGKKRRQTFVFSATLTMVHDLPWRLKNNRRKRRLSEKDKLEQLMKVVGISAKPKVVDLTRKLGTAETLCESRIVCSSAEDKDIRLYYFLLAHPGRTIVFCNSIDSVRRLTSVLGILECAPLSLHASMQQRQRLKNLDRFRDSPVGLLLATDVAARGLDIQGIEHVVHFQVPRTAEVYVHRSGRTARAESVGLSVMLVEPRELAIYRKICRTLNREQDLPDFPVDNDVLKVVRDRVSLARTFEAESHRVRRRGYENSWLERAAREMDIELDKRLVQDKDEKKTADDRRRLKAMKTRLEQMLRTPLFPAGFSGKYLTRKGELMLPRVRGPHKAVEAIQGKNKKAAVGVGQPSLEKKRKIRKRPRFKKNRPSASDGPGVEQTTDATAT